MSKHASQKKESIKHSTGETLVAPEAGRASSSVSDFVSRLVAWDESAWRYLWQRYAGIMLGFARKLIHTRNWVPLIGQEEDVLLESFERLLKGIGRFRGSSYAELEGFMRQNLRFTCLQKLRDIGPYEEPSDPMDSGAGRAADSFTVAECEHLLRQAVQNLPRELADIVYMNVKGYDSREIAASRNLSRQAVFDRKHRALQLLREYLLAQRFWEHCSSYVSEIRLISRGDCHVR